MRTFASHVVLTYPGRSSNATSHLMGFPLTTGPVISLDVLLDRCTHQIPPLCPGAVIIPHARVTQQVHQDKPGVARALPNAAIGNDVITGFEAGSAFVEFFELFDVLERGIRSHGL